ncbi:hypothetical protein BDFB_004464 [Asbolus verrucosus]|uniref:Uncharacterized protein n=1 Tax=Asbolus verrucosus TaxID=1661398 RepID=A0A482VLH5_ASBVE|nr:hypothetical protein BDFB_004464 [Asbolus verrucosus]
MKQNLIMKPKNHNLSSSQVKNDLKSKCDIVSLKVNVNNIKHVKNGVLINCEGNSSLDKLKTKLTAEVGESYDVIVPPKFFPCIVTYGI